VSLRRSLQREGVAQVHERGNRQLVTSVESFLAGTYENYLLANNQIVPVWARINCLAHGYLGAISKMAERADPFDLQTLAWDAGAWVIARSALALDLVRLVQGRAGAVGTSPTSDPYSD
jgi:hypothetical protein